MNFLTRSLEKLISTGFYIACACLFSLVVVISADILFRILGFSFFKGAVEITEYSLLLIALMAAPWLYKTNGNITIDIFTSGLSEKNKVVHAYFVDIVVLIISSIVFTFSVKDFVDSYEQGVLIFKILIFPEWWIKWILPFSMFLIGAQSIVRLSCTFCLKKRINIDAEV